MRKLFVNYESLEMLLKQYIEDIFTFKFKLIYLCGNFPAKKAPQRDLHNKINSKKLIKTSFIKKNIPQIQ